MDCQYLLLGSVGDSDTGVSHSEAHPNYHNMLRKGQQTPVELWVADNLFLEKVTGAFECCRLLGSMFFVALHAVREPFNIVIPQ